MIARAAKLSKILEELDDLKYVVEDVNTFRIGNYTITETDCGWIANGDYVQSPAFSTRMAAISWAKFLTDGKLHHAKVVELLSEELDAATTHVKQLSQASKKTPEIAGKVDIANDKRIKHVETLARFILKNS